MKEIVLILFLSLPFIIVARMLFINIFKITYYETKLKNMNVDISHVEKIGIIEILKL